MSKRTKQSDLSPLEILQTMIERGGDCSDFAYSVCLSCPLGNKTIDGRPVSCGDYVNSLVSLHKVEVNEAFKRVAEEELFSLSLEQALKED